jgi:hypothetical protein
MGMLCSWHQLAAHYHKLPNLITEEELQQYFYSGRHAMRAGFNNLSVVPSQKLAYDLGKTCLY